MPNLAKQKFPFHYRQSPNTNYTFKFQSTLGKIGIACLNKLVKIWQIVPGLG